MANALAVTLQASAEALASGAADGVEIAAIRSCVKLRLDLTALTAGAKLTVYIDTGASATGPWRSLGAFPALLVAATKDQTFADCLAFVRARWVLEGATPSATFSVAGAAHVLYAKVGDLDAHGIPAAAIGSASQSVQAECCLAATNEADGYLGGGKTLPLTAWESDLTDAVAQIAVYKIMKRRGFQPQGSDELIVKGRDDAISWLRGVARGDIEPPGLVDSTPEAYEASVSVYSDTQTNSGGEFW
jgi:phage gp36-like protein